MSTEKAPSARAHWLVVAACCGLFASAIGIACNSVGVFYAPVSEALGVGRGTFALHVTLGSLGTGFFGPVVVRLLRRMPLRLVLGVSIVIAGVSTMLMAMAENVLWFYPLGLLRGVCVSCYGAVPITIILGNWFHSKNGMATGIAFCCSGVGGAVFSPVFSGIIAGAGWRTAYLVMGALIILLALPGALFVLRLTPEESGLLPYGEKTAVPAAGAASAAQTSSGKKEKLYGGAFVSLAAIAFCGSIVTVLGQYFPDMAQSFGKSATLGALMVSGSMIGNLLGKLLLGAMGDRMGAAPACLMMLGVNFASMIAMALLFASGSGGSLPLIACSFLFGMVYSICTVGMSLLVRAAFGNERYAEVFPTLSIFGSIGAAVAFSGLGFLYDFTHTYMTVLIACISLSGLCIAALFMAARYTRGKTKKSDA